MDRRGWQPSGPVEEACRWAALGEYDKASVLGAVAVEPLALVLKDAVYYKRQAVIEAGPTPHTET